MEQIVKNRISYKTFCIFLETTQIKVKKNYLK